MLPVVAVALMATTTGNEALAQSVQSLPVVNAVWQQNIEEQVADAATEAETPKTLNELVDEQMDGEALDAEARCLATAVYFEARSETLEGQLAVAEVVMNRAASPRYPSSWCRVVKQYKQFSFVKGGRFPKIATSSDAWANAKAIARVAISGAHDVLEDDVLWYHANYVKPKWRHKLQRAARVGVHVFYRA